LKQDPTNIYAANYYNPAEHTKYGFPVSFQNPYTPPATANEILEAYYDLGCVDQAEDYIARIRVQVRSWNMYSEWQKGGSGNPELGRGTPEPPPYQQFPLDDFWDWFYFGNNFPGITN
jgi:hypothetical protein